MHPRHQGRSIYRAVVPGGRWNILRGLWSVQNKQSLRRSRNRRSWLVERRGHKTVAPFPKLRRREDANGALPLGQQLGLLPLDQLAILPDSSLAGERVLWKWG